MSEERARQAEGVLRGEGHGSEGHHRQMQSPGFSWALPLGLCSQKELALELGLEYWPLQFFQIWKPQWVMKDFPFLLSKIFFSFPPSFYFYCGKKIRNIKFTNLILRVQLAQ